MKNYLLPNTGNFYKANLHVHTNVSDGRLSPEEMKNGYKSNGYSILAYTDHEVFVNQNELTDSDFLAINSLEIAVNDDFSNDFNHTKTYHLNFYAKSNTQTECPVSTEDSVWLEHSKQYVSQFVKQNKCSKTYTVKDINNLIKLGNDNGFLVTYNHPVWSLQNYSDYIDLKGLWGVEVHNTGCVVGGYVDTVQPFEDLLRNGERVVPICADDAHNLNASAYGGWTMVKAEKLEYSAVMKALEKGEMYSSNGPSIYELYEEDGLITIKTSNAVKISVITDIRIAKVKNATANEPITEVTFDLKDFILEAKNANIKRRGKAWFRLEVKDASGKIAYTRAYFVDELA